MWVGFSYRVKYVQMCAAGQGARHSLPRYGTVCEIASNRRILPERFEAMSFERLIASLRRLTQQVDGDPSSAVPSPYEDALRDLFKALGILSKDGQTFSTRTAYFFAQSLLRCVEEDALTASAWHGTPDEPCSGIGALLTQALEQHRRVCSPHPQPLRVIRAVAAIIKARRNGEDVYLMQYDAPARQFQLLGGKREHEDDSNAATLVRELREELLMDHLLPGRDFTLYPLVEGVRETSVSDSVYVLSAYEHSFYQLLDVRFNLPTDEHTRWLTSQEVVSGQTRDGLKVSRLIATYLAEILPSLRYSLSAAVE